MGPPRERFCYKRIDSEAHLTERMNKMVYLKSIYPQTCQNDFITLVRPASGQSTPDWPASGLMRPARKRMTPFFLENVFWQVRDAPVGCVRGLRKPG